MVALCLLSYIRICGATFRPVPASPRGNLLKNIRVPAMRRRCAAMAGCAVVLAVANRKREKNKKARILSESGPR
jgi:hypothetical protein